MMKRILSGIIAATLLVALIFLGSRELMVSVVLMCSVLGVLEYEGLFFPERSIVRQLRLAFLVMFSILAIKYDLRVVWVFFWVAFVSHGISSVIRSNWVHDFEKILQAFWTELFGCIYLVALFGFLLPIFMSGTLGREFLLLMFLVVALGDTAAYCIGLRFGKRLLAPRISPKKTIEGAIASVAMSLLASVVWLFAIYSGPVSSTFIIAILAFGAVGGVLAQFGDLFESVLKRSKNKKDSGFFLPGHGGILDRTDGLAFVAPLFYFYVQFVLGRIL